MQPRDSLPCSHWPWAAKPHNKMPAPSQPCLLQGASTLLLMPSVNTPNNETLSQLLDRTVHKYVDGWSVNFCELPTCSCATQNRAYSAATATRCVFDA